jgi:hypothetical protein
VDEYDAPANNSAFNGQNPGFHNETITKLHEIEQFFKQNFFADLKQGCGGLGASGAVISKLFVTGITPAFRSGMSPLGSVSLVSGHRRLHGMCGFTKAEVKAIVQHYLRKGELETEEIVYSMQKLYNGYFFAEIPSDEINVEIPQLYNPHLVFHFISELQSNGLVAKPEDSTANYSTTILKSIADMGEFSVIDLVDLITSGSVKTKIVTEFGFPDLLTIGKEKHMTFSFLFYLGILTRGSDGNLRIPNEVIKLDACTISSFYSKLSGKNNILPF